MNELDIAKLRDIARNLSDYGVALQQRTSPLDQEAIRALGLAFVDVSDAIGDLATKAR